MDPSIWTPPLMHSPADWSTPPFLHYLYTLLLIFHFYLLYFLVSDKFCFCCNSIFIKVNAGILTIPLLGP